MRALLYSIPILICFLVSAVNCEEDESGNSSWWGRVRERVKSILNDWKDSWVDFKEKFKATAKEVGSMSQEAWNDMRNNMIDWIKSQTNVNDAEQLEMTNFIERLQMPEEGNKEENK